MFDDYEYKNSKRISIRFVQERDEPMYPWEIGGFLDNINTIYYKFDLLNSICSAIKEGINPSDIFVFDKSLPLYKRYSEMNLLGESQAASNFYSIGLPYPLFPNKDIYEYNLLYQAFYAINSFLLKEHVRPLSIKNIANAYHEMRTKGLDTAESFIIDLAEERAKKSFKNSKKENKKLLTRDQISNSLDKYRNRKEKLFNELIFIGNLDNDRCVEIIESNKITDKSIAKTLLAFFRYFDRTSRPLVCARVSHGKFRVLGRSLINKREKNGLELKDASRKSPFGTIFECGITMLQALTGETRASELHQLELEKKKTEIEVTKEMLAGEKLKNFKLTIEIQNEIDKASRTSDIQAVRYVPDSYLKQKMLRTYAEQEKHTVDMLNNKGFYPDSKSVHIIDTKA